MASQPELFDVSGPLHLLTSFDWRNTFHRRSLAASLVQGVYSLERDRQRVKMEQHEAHASPWWERFHFQLNHVLVDDTDLSYFGAIYELKYAHPCFYQSTPYPPRYVIAFRGTLITSLTRYEDMKLNMRCVFAKLYESLRFRKAFEAVWNTVIAIGPANVWIAGHSLGASIAMLVGKNMAKSRYHLETYLFNPPFISVLPIEQMIKNETLKDGVRIAGSFMTAGIATAMNIHRDDSEEDLFTLLSEWTPYVYVNPSDPICSEFIGYFQHREKMDEMGVGKYERIATQYSFGSLVSGAIGRDMEPLHIVPTAYMTVNISSSEDLRQAHGIVQWWQPHYEWQSKLYKFKSL
ncbi:putative fungal lipase-like domain, alpha/Beta hydrolase [Helianthus annuus]|uniref:Fungal lipase-like domain, alpha/Beta hydrolase n=1 Tax=Helianthus annuus TaxID=4232 RepID=A0A251SC01_HELAN|nr:GDSL esterase/lipase At4g10955 [Helianthus annuus]KAF5766837.1 putative fungal lipase-like domain, alpha/Beta hydrolase [Helianthus annuus]KAJ0453170.1 putative fungal lipase-like domain, alpha/Beta hydrolase [Helianthus annuus]KAJ0475087.1 putative fungal lipase-like domain, alpha/Beta hydrolase [Helianthus annuus]KAJ0833471.1 putative fungal lipase-like domain, alpha/Beta hydrolase [Helianthus annuus]